MFDIFHISIVDFFHFRKDISANYLIRGRQKIFHRSLFLRELIFEGHWGGWLTTDPESLLSLCSINVERNYLCRGHQNLLENAHRRVFFCIFKFSLQYKNILSWNGQSFWEYPQITDDYAPSRGQADLQLSGVDKYPITWEGVAKKITYHYWNTCATKN